jgi:hypothetical protein
LGLMSPLNVIPNSILMFSCCARGCKPMTHEPDDLRKK